MADGNDIAVSYLRFYQILNYFLLDVYELDDTYVTLQARYQHKGKGRPKDLPKEIVSNNKLFVQLSYLREEGNHTWAHVLKVWIPEIFPNLRLVTGSDFRYKKLIVAARNSYSSTPPNLLEEFLSTYIDLNFISQACAAVGITRSTFATPPSELFDPPLQVTNELVIDLVRFRNSQSQSLNKSSIVAWLNSLTGFNKNKINYSVESTYKKYIRLKKDVRRNPDALKDFKACKFTLCSSPVLTNAAKCKSLDYECEKCVQMQVEISNLTAALISVQKENCLLKKKLDDVGMSDHSELKKQCLQKD